MSQTPWWALPLVAALFAVGGVLAALFMTGRADRRRRAEQETERWYAERRAAYVALLATFLRSTARLGRDVDQGVARPDLLRYLDEVGAALVEVRLVASLPVRNAALAVHRLIEQLHDEAYRGGSYPRLRELLAHVPLVTQAFEVAVRDELGLQLGRPLEPLPPIDGADGRRTRLAALTRRWRPAAARPPERVDAQG